MFKAYLFKNALRIRKNINYNLNNIDMELSRFVNLPQWVDLVNKYTLMKLSNYNIKDMFKLYINSKIKIEVDNQPIYYKLEDIEIYNYSIYDYFKLEYIQNKWNKISNNTLFFNCLLKDDIVHEQAGCWYVVHKGDIITIEVILSFKDKVRKLTNIVDFSKTNNDILFSTLIFSKFLIEKMNFKTIYRMLPKSYTYQECKKIKNIIKYKQIYLNTCFKYIYPEYFLKKNSVKEIKDMVYIK